MAFYNSNSYSYYDYDYKDYKDDYNTHQDSYSYSDYEFQPQNFLNSTSYYNNQFQYNPTNISYSTSFFYDPKAYNHVLAQTEYMVSYSVSQSGKVNHVEYDDEYDEYDPTPYGGGYDLVLTYGKPLPPSDEICYPRSSHHNHQVQDRVDDPSMGVSGFNGVLALDDIPYVDEEFDKPRVEDVNMEKVDEKVVEQEEQKKNLIEYTPNWSDVDSGNVNKRNGNDYNGENENLVVELETQSGYDDSKAMDLCESLFGYWNGLSLQKGEEDKNYGGQGGHVDNVDTNPMSQWEGPADYLFGCSDSHGELRIETGMYDSPIFGYEKHYQEPLQYGQVEYDPYYYHNCRVSEHEF